MRTMVKGLAQGKSFAWAISMILNRGDDDDDGSLKGFENYQFAQILLINYFLLFQSDYHITNTFIIQDFK